MQFSLRLSTNHHTPWNLSNSNEPTPPTNQNLSFRRVAPLSSLRTSLDCVSDGGVAKEVPVRLPFVVVRRPTETSRFFWVGNCLKVVTVDGGAAANADVDFDDRVLRVFGSVVREFFIPRGVTGNYVEYVKWKLLHRVFSSALQVLATQVSPCLVSVKRICFVCSESCLSLQDIWVCLVCANCKSNAIFCMFG